MRASTAILTQPLLLALFVGGYSAAFALRAIAWSALLGAAPRPGAVRLFGFLQVALLANHVFPTKVGEVVRVALLARAGTPVELAFGSTVVARLLDLASLCLLALVGAAVNGWVSGATAVSLLAPVLTLLAGGGLAFLLARGGGRLVAMRLPARVAGALYRVQAALRDISPRHVALALLATLPSWILEALALWTVARAAGVDISPWLAVAATAFTIAFQGFQITPGGLGLYEASLTLALTTAGVDPATALALAVATHALKFCYSFVFGLTAAAAEVLPVQCAAAIVRSVRVVDVGFLVALAAAWLGGTSALACFVGGAALVPLLVAFRCHYLPRALSPLLLVVGVLFVFVFGLRSPVEAGADRPVQVAAFGIVSLVLLVLARQWWLARHPLPPPGPLPKGSLIAVVIPVRNEAAVISDVVSSVPRQALDACGLPMRVIVVDDGSTDGSGALAVSAGADQVVTHTHGQGLGAALRAGLATARQVGAEAVVYLDGDGEYDPADLPRVIEPILAGHADYVLGTRDLTAGSSVRWPRRIGNRVFTLLQRVLTGRQIRDGQTGFRAFGPRALAVAEIIHDYNYAQVLTLDLVRKRLRLGEVAISYRPRRTGQSFIRYHEYALRVLPAIAREVLTR